MGGMFEEIGASIGVIGGWVAITLAIAAWLANRLSSRIEQRWQHSLDSQLEQVKADLSKNRDLLNSSLKALGFSSEKMVEKRIEAIHTLWRGMTSIRRSFGIAFMFYDLTAIKEYGDPQSLAFAESFNFGAAHLELKEADDEIRRLRPFLGETLYMQWEMYRAFIGRVGSVLNNSAANGEVEHWSKDGWAPKIIRRVLTEEEIGAIEVKIDEPGDLGYTNSIATAIEIKMLHQMELILTGKATAEQAVVDALSLSRLMNSIDIPG